MAGSGLRRTVRACPRGEAPADAVERSSVAARARAAHAGRAGAEPWSTSCTPSPRRSASETVAVCDYGGPVAAAVEPRHVWGTQFHPEKSGAAGLALLANFVRLRLPDAGGRLRLDRWSSSRRSTCAAGAAVRLSRATSPASSATGTRSPWPRLRRPPAPAGSTWSTSTRRAPASRRTGRSLARSSALARGRAAGCRSAAGSAPSDDAEACSAPGWRGSCWARPRSRTRAGRRVRRRWPGRVAVGLDHRRRADGVAEAPARGGRRARARRWPTCSSCWARRPLGAVVVTAIARDGTLRGPDLEGWRALLDADRRSRSSRRAGCGDLEDLSRAGRASRPAGRRLAGVIVGKALFDGSIRGGGGGRRVRSIRVIPCLDVTAGRVVKGVQFLDLSDAGDPVELAARYDAEGADELVFLDITASPDGRDTMVDVVARTAEQVFIPLTVGGGVRSADDARRLLRAGADKVAVNTAAVADPSWSRARRRVRGPVRRGGHRRPAAGPGGAAGRSTPTAAAGPTGLDAVAWAAECAANGAGEILLTSMDRDGTRDGFDLELTRAVVDAVGIPVVASGGVGTPRPPGRRGAVPAAPTRCWPRRSSTGASSRCRGQGLLASHGVAVRRPDLVRPVTAPGARSREACTVGPRAMRHRRPGSAGPTPTTSSDKQPITMLFDRVLVQVPATEGERRSRAGILIPATAQCAPADLGRGGGGRARTCGRSRPGTRCCSTPRTASRSRSRARST